MKSAGWSIVGPSGTNHDVILLPFPVRDSYWCAIADGVGLTDHSALAAEAAISTVRSVTDSTSMTDLFKEVQKSLLKHSTDKTSSKQLSTTLSVLKIVRNEASVGHVGDTRISHYRGSGVLARTKDQTEVQALLDQGALSKYQAARYPRRNVLISALSPLSKYDLFETHFTVQEGDRVILTTDGFHNKLLRRQIAQISVETPDFDTFIDRLKRDSLQIEFDDDASLIALEI